MPFARVSALVALGIAAVSVTACTTTVEGRTVAAAGAPRPVTAPAPWRVPSQPPAPTPRGAELTSDELVHAVNAGATRYWARNGALFPAMTTVAVSTPDDCLDADDATGVCDGILYYRADLVSTLNREYGDVAVTEVVAHEVGHALMHYTHTDEVSIITLETRADCASGAYTAAAFPDVAEIRARELFGHTAMNDRRGEGDTAFTTGFRAQRRGQDTESTCTTYDYAK